MVETKGGLKVKDFGKFSSQHAFEPHTFKGKVKTKGGWKDAEWNQEGNCINMKGDELFIGATKHTPTTEEEFRRFSKDEKLERAFFFIDADSFAQFELWKENKHTDQENYKVNWVQDTCGFMQTIGSLYRKEGKKYKELPVNISFSFALLNDVYVCFYDSQSQVTDWKIIEEFVSKYAGQYDSASRRAMTDAQNFHHCVHYCQKPH